MTCTSLQTTALVAASTLLAFARCSPFSVPVPFYFGEGPHTLPRGGVRIDVLAGGGYGGIGAYSSGGGGGARVRASMGRAGEIGISGHLIAGVERGVSGTESGSCDSYFAAKADYKLAISSWSAVLVGAGGGSSNGHGVAGGDLGFVFGDTKQKTFAPHFGIRGGFSAPPRSVPGVAATFYFMAATGLRIQLARPDVFWVLELGGGALHVPDAASNSIGGAFYGATGLGLEL